jgi:hypothetical protein
MATVDLPNVRQNQSGSVEEEVKNLKDAYFMLRKKLSFLLSGALDSENVVEAASVIADWVYAGTIVADQISGGTISGVTINVNTDLTVGNNINVGSLSADGVYKIIKFFGGESNYTAALAAVKSAGVTSLLIYSEDGLTLQGTTIAFSGTVTGLDSSGWAKMLDVQNWVNANFVHK